MHLQLEVYAAICMWISSLQQNICHRQTYIDAGIKANNINVDMN